MKGSSRNQHKQRAGNRRKEWRERGIAANLIISNREPDQQAIVCTDRIALSGLAHESMASFHRNNSPILFHREDSRSRRNLRENKGVTVEDETRDAKRKKEKKRQEKAKAKARVMRKRWG